MKTRFIKEGMERRKREKKKKEKMGIRETTCCYDRRKKKKKMGEGFKAVYSLQSEDGEDGRKLHERESSKQYIVTFRV